MNELKIIIINKRGSRLTTKIREMTTELNRTELSPPNSNSKYSRE